MCIRDREYGPLKNVIISGCTLTSTSAALKIGTEGTGDFENVEMCIRDSVRTYLEQGIPTGLGTDVAGGADRKSVV